MRRQPEHPGVQQLDRRSVWVGRALLVPVWVIVAMLLALAAGHVIAYDRSRAVMLADAYTLWVFLPAYVVLVAALCFRTWSLALVAAVIVAAHLAWVVPTTLHTVTVTAAAREAPHVRVASANLRYDNTDHGPLLAELGASHADIIVVEEVTPAWWRAIRSSGLLASHPDTAKALRDDPGGMAILSRLPLEDVVVHRAGGWPIITATVHVAGRALHLGGVHLVAPLETFARNQRAQRAITSIAASMPRPRLVIGDFNASPYNRWFDQMLGLGLRDAHQAVGRPFATTWPNGMHRLPPLLLDHAFVDRSVVPVAVREGRGRGSDHRPIVVDLAVER
ncbi:MAG TPA: endonuclease/exonuclease/phosphatase family protein [Acidimicrobiia bacterium]|jgi:endonuclease/exonuclease/phosphatase (EEP) superfamily protein YafD